MKKSHVGWQTLVVILLATVYVAAPGLSLAGTAKGVRLSIKVADPQTDFLAVQGGSEEHTTKLPSRLHLDCPLLPEQNRRSENHIGIRHARKADTAQSHMPTCS